MINPSYPPFEFKTRKEGEITRIFCEARKIWVRLTPEEWVRQNFYQWLVQHMKYPSSMIAVEKEIKLFDLVKRFDILVYNTDHTPWLMVECKAQTVPLTEKTLMQVLRYNMALPVPYIVMTNGSYVRAIAREGDSVREITELPPYRSSAGSMIF
ncbi:MAG TPA: type I restriction enzyme HsdR N-terminal domain-containing protein [Chitinophagaceae bacterium]|nr:type I restriction enzyme HsdR N-terminal domain-containing protein [Chitinophagaceae bacterium]